MVDVAWWSLCHDIVCLCLKLVGCWWIINMKLVLLTLLSDFCFLWCWLSMRWVYAGCCLNPSLPEAYMNLVAYYCSSCVRANTMLCPAVVISICMIICYCYAENDVYPCCFAALSCQGNLMNMMYAVVHDWWFEWWLVMNTCYHAAKPMLLNPAMINPVIFPEN